MTIVETVKNFLRQPEEVTTKTVSSTVDPERTVHDLTNHDLYPSTGAFFDDDKDRTSIGIIPFVPVFTVTTLLQSPLEISIS